MRSFVQKTIIKSGLVSVIIPTYNTNELFLRQAIDSVVAQTYDNWELLIIDDSTTSPVENIVKLVDIFLHTEFEGGRHSNRIQKIMSLEK